jgi:hypothetical protein
VGARGEAEHRWFGEEEEKKRRDGREEKKMEKLEQTSMFV